MAEDYSDEKWKTLKLPGYIESDRFQISNHGRVRRWKPNRNDWKFLKPTKVNGYNYMSFRNEKDWRIRKTFSIHRLTAEYFLRTPKNPAKRFVIHLDFDKTNNYIKNLKFVDQQGLTKHNSKNPNVINSVRKGLITYSKLNEEQVLELKRRVKKGEERLYKIAQDYGITHTQLNRIRKGENWAHVKLPEDEK